MHALSKLFTFTWQFSLVVIAMVMLCAAAGVGIGRETVWSQSLKLATTAAGGRGVLNLASTNDVAFSTETVGTLTVTNLATAGSLTIVTNLTLSGASASLPLFTDGSKIAVSKSVANTLLALGIQTGSGTTATDGTVTNTFGAAFGSAPSAVIVEPVGATLVLTNNISAITTTNFVLTFGAASATFKYVAIGAP